jgi:hypothetical protein
MDTGKYRDAWAASSPALHAASTADSWQQFGELEFRPRRRLRSRSEGFSLYTRRDESGKPWDYLVVSFNTRVGDESGTFPERVNPGLTCLAGEGGAWA